MLFFPSKKLYMLFREIEVIINTINEISRKYMRNWITYIKRKTYLIVYSWALHVIDDIWKQKMSKDEHGMGQERAYSQRRQSFTSQRNSVFQFLFRGLLSFSRNGPSRILHLFSIYLFILTIYLLYEITVAKKFSEEKCLKI